MSSTSRRDFVRNAALTGLAAAPALRSANDTINLGVVGIRGRGNDHIRTFGRIPGVRITSLCDVDERLFPDRSAAVEKLSGAKPATFTDVRKMLEQKDLDAISVATPDHWHALCTIWACQAGKDVYCEKPVSHNLSEGRKMVQAARKYNRIVQAGLNRRSEARNKAGAKFVQEGGFGPVYRAKAVVYRGRLSVGRVKESSIPEGVHWDTFLGPAAYKPFNLTRFHYGWHYFWDTATTEVGNNGVHAIDVVRWALGKNVHPVKVVCSGGLYAEKDTDQETPNVQNATYEYSDGTLMDLEVTTLPSPSFGGVQMGEFFYTPTGYVTSSRNWSTVEGEFIAGASPAGPNGIDNRASNLSFPKISYKPGPAVPDIGATEVSHFQNFIDCVRSRKREDLNCEIEQGHLSTSLCHLANIAFRTGRKLVFDPASETFPGDKEANALLTRRYRAPFTVPDKV